MQSQLSLISTGTELTLYVEVSLTPGYTNIRLVQDVGGGKGPSWVGGTGLRLGDDTGI